MNRKLLFILLVLFLALRRAVLATDAQRRGR